jgi:hypothetical protein
MIMPKADNDYKFTGENMIDYLDNSNCIYSQRSFVRKNISK